MSTAIHIPAHEAHVVRVFDVIEEAGAPLADEAVMDALGADGEVQGAQIELFDLGDLGGMSLSEYLAEGHGIARRSSIRCAGSSTG